MSNNFWIGLAVIGGAAYFLWPKKAAAGTAANPSEVAGGTTLTGGPDVSAYGQYPGLSQNGVAGVNTTQSGGSSGTLDNSRVFDPYAQAQATVWSSVDPATGLPYVDRSMQLDGGGTGEWTQGDGYQYRSVSE